MTSATDQESATPTTPSATESGSTTAGQLLRAARLRAGVHLAVLSVTLKVPVRQLEALEADQLDLTKGPVFYRALAASLCRHLQTDPAPVLALLPASSPHLEPLRTNAQAPDRLPSPAVLTGGLRPSRVFWAAALMLSLTAALLWMPGPSQWAWLDDVQALLAQGREDGPGEERHGTDAMGASPSVVVTDVSPLGAQPAGGVNAPAQALPQAAGASQAPTQAAAVGTPAAGVSADAPAEWVFTATEESWLELRNAQKAVVWSGILQPGVSTRIPSPVPVSVVVGRAPVVTATWRGQAFDLKPHTSVTVARFEVKE